MLFRSINGTLSFYEANKAGNAVAALKASLKPNAVVKRDGKWQNMDAALVVPGDLVMLGAGAAVPADCRVNAGRIEVDQAALTGESLPVKMVAGGEPKMGSTIVRGEVEATVEATGSRTFLGKTAAMIGSVDERSRFEKVGAGFARLCLPYVVGRYHACPLLLSRALKRRFLRLR